MHRLQSSDMATFNESRISSDEGWTLASDNYENGECPEYAVSRNYSSVGWVILGYFQVGYVPTIALAGIFGNVLSILVFLRTNLRTRSSSYYLAALAAADTTFLAQLLIVSLSYLDVDLYNRDVGCQTLVYLSSVSTFLSVWLVVSFTVERFIAIQYPFQRPKMCTVQRAKRTICGLVLFALVINSYLLFSAVAVKENGRIICDIYPPYHHIFYFINVVDTVATLVLPVTLIVVMNTMITIKFFKFSRSHRRAEQEAAVAQSEQRPRSSTCHPMSLVVNGVMVRDVSLIGQQLSCSSTQSLDNNRVFLQKSINLISRHYPYGGGGCGDRKLMSKTTLSHTTQHNVTKMLLLISTTFVCLNMPSYVMRIHNYYNQNCVSESQDLLQQYTMLLFYTNFSTNFLLYSTCGISFRRALCEFVRRNFS